MNRLPQSLLYSAAALSLAALAFLAGRRQHRINALRNHVEAQERRLRDLEEYLRPLRDYSKGL